VNLVVIAILAVLWALFLVPQFVRARAERGPADSIGNFRRQLSVLERTAPGAMRPTGRPLAPYHQPRPAFAPPARPMSTMALSRSQARKRRRDIFCGLLAAMAGSLLLGLLPPLRVMLTLHVILDLLFIGYVAMLVRIRNAATERDLKVRFLPASGGPEPALLLRRSVN
jgi:hypothetical protein